MEYFVVIHGRKHYGPYTKEEAEHVKQRIWALPATFSEPRIEPLLVWTGAN